MKYKTLGKCNPQCTLLNLCPNVSAQVVAEALNWPRFLTKNPTSKISCVSWDFLKDINGVFLQGGLETLD